jgi:hypothetical protein
LKAETEKAEARLSPGMVKALQKAARVHWNSGATYAEWIDKCRELRGGLGFSTFYCHLLRFFLRKTEGYTVTAARLDIREPMPYETYIGGQLLKEGTAPGFVGIVGTAVKDAIDGQRVVKVMSRQIGKPFYQYTSHSNLIPTRKPKPR